jgi:hypothetical protein
MLARMEKARLLARYIERGSEPWNLSPEAAYLDYRLRAWAAELVPPVVRAALNVGIGEGSWDDYLGHLLAGRAALTSLDIDPRVCEMLAYRQRREGHPNPSRVICASTARTP